MKDELSSPARSSFILHPSSLPGFTLVELLIVIGLIVLLATLAIPTFSVITGSRSVDSAANTISAFLGRARMEAIGLQETRGVMFFNDPLSGSTKVAILRQAPRPTGNSGDVNNPHVRVYLDLADNKEFLTLPTGVGIQTVDDCSLNTSVTPWQRQDDGYIGFNVDFRQAAVTPPKYVKTTGDQTTNNPAGVRFGGVILFDSAGRIICEPYAFRARQLDASGSNYEATSVGSLLLGSETAARATLDIIPHLPNATPATASVQRSQLGFVLFQKSVFEGRGSTAGDWQLAGSGAFSSSSELEEERWLDENATVYLINRYNGTLVKGE